MNQGTMATGAATTGAATTASQQGLEDSLIQTLGRWRSEAYKIYIKLPRAQLASVSRALAQGQ